MPEIAADHTAPLYRPSSLPIIFLKTVNKAFEHSSERRKIMAKTHQKKSKEDWKNQKKTLEKIFLREQDKIAYEAENLIRFLKFASGFTRYSYRNQLLIYSQCPNATLVATYLGWKKRGRYVKANEKRIEIFKPCHYKREIHVDKADDTDDKRQDGSGTDTDKKTVEYTGFNIEYVFDVSQTEGSEIPRLAAEDEDPMFETTGDLYEALKPLCNNVRNDMDCDELLLAASAKYLEKPTFPREETSACAYVLKSYMQLGSDPDHAARIIDWAKGRKSEEFTGFMTRVMKASGKIIRELEVA